MTSSLVALLQGALFLLTTLQTNHALPLATQQQMLAAATQAVELASQIAAQPTTNSTSTSIAPNVERLRSAFYLNSHGMRTPLGQTLLLLDSYTSFGDLDHDANDDAVVLVKDTDSSTPYHLAVMLNDNGSLFNVANLAMPNLQEIYTHKIQEGIFTIDYATKDGARQTVKYKLSSGSLVTL